MDPVTQDWVRNRLAIAGAAIFVITAIEYTIFNTKVAVDILWPIGVVLLICGFVD